jgi:hypothetical protein
MALGLGFQAALYREPLTTFGLGRTLVSPFVRAKFVRGVWVAAPVLRQHLAFVEMIKQHRVWARSDRDGWFCVFALNIEWVVATILFDCISFI